MPLLSKTFTCLLTQRQQDLKHRPSCPLLKDTQSKQWEGCNTHRVHKPNCHSQGTRNTCDLGCPSPPQKNDNLPSTYVFVKENFNQGNAFMQYSVEHAVLFHSSIAQIKRNQSLTVRCWLGETPCVSPAHLRKFPPPLSAPPPSWLSLPTVAMELRGSLANTGNPTTHREQKELKHLMTFTTWPWIQDYLRDTLYPYCAFLN